MKNFSDYLERAIRHGTLPPADDGGAISHANGLPSPPATDWSPYYVNYNLLKLYISSYLPRLISLFILSFFYKTGTDARPEEWPSPGTYTVDNDTFAKRVATRHPPP